MKKMLMNLLVSLMLVILLVSCGGAKRRLQEKMVEAVENAAEEQGVELHLDPDDLEESIMGTVAENFEEAVGDALDEGALDNLTDAFNEDSLEELTSAFGELENILEYDGEGALVNLHFEDESGEMNFDGSTPWPEAMPGRVPEYTHGSLLSYQMDPGEVISVIIMNTSREEVQSYINDIQSTFPAVAQGTEFDSGDQGIYYVGASDQDGIQIGYNDGGLALVYYFNTDFVEAWQP